MRTMPFVPSGWPNPRSTCQGGVKKKKKEFRDRDSSREGRGRQQVAGLDGHNGIIRCTTLAVGAAQDEEVQARRGRRTELRKACFC